MAKSTNINNRRYLGNKYKLLPFIKKVVDSECTDIEIVVDIFSGTGAVASAFQDKQLITNDILYSNYISNFAWFSPRKYSRKKIETIIDEYNAMVINEENYMTINFSNTYFSHDDCSKIGYIREDIETKYANKEINERERALLITSLLYAMDKIAKTCGHYDAYRQGVEFDMHLELLLPEASITNNKKNKCYNIDSNDLAGKIVADLVYIDPPYNSRQYCDAYHLLENVARWEKPEVFGVAKKMDRTALKSKYCTKSAAEAFDDLIKQLKCTDKDFVYVDPPYLITCAAYNEQGGWSEVDEEDLLQKLDDLSQRGIKFALSNVLESKGRENVLLRKWIESRPNYKMVDLNYSYNNANYQRQNKEQKTREILVVNY